MNIAAGGDDVIYSVKGYPDLIYNNNGGKQLLFWDPPDFSFNTPYGPKSGASLGEILGSPFPYVLVARKINEMLKANQCVCVERIDADDPVTYAAWQINNGEYRIMAGNLEEGINQTGNFVRTATIDIPRGWTTGGGVAYRSLWQGSGGVLNGDRQLPITLGQADSELYEVETVRAGDK
jgi:hypothetical protein